MPLPIDHFDLIAPLYDRLFGRGSDDGVLSDLALEPGMVVLDIGGGTGRLAERIAASGGRVVVLDASPGMLGHTRGRGVDAARSHAERLPLPDGSVDRVVVVDALHHFAHQWRAVDEMVRVLAPGGRIVVEEPDIRRLTVKAIAAGERVALMRSRFFSPGDLQSLFTAAGAVPTGMEVDGFTARMLFDKPGGARDRGQLPGRAGAPASEGPSATAESPAHIDDAASGAAASGYA